MNLGENIYRCRTQNNLSQGDLADALDVSRQSVSKWENNMAVPDLDKLTRMAQLFGITLDELVTGNAPAAPEPVKETVPFSFILSIVMFALAGAALLITVLFGNHFGIHTDEGIMLALLLALVGAIVRKVQDRKLFDQLLTVYVPLLFLVVICTFLPLLPERFLGYMGAYGLVLLVWYLYLRRTAPEG